MIDRYRLFMDLSHTNVDGEWVKYEDHLKEIDRVIEIAKTGKFTVGTIVEEIQNDNK